MSPGLFLSSGLKSKTSPLSELPRQSMDVQMRFPAFPLNRICLVIRWSPHWLWDRQVQLEKIKVREAEKNERIDLIGYKEQITNWII